jgi:hypothetical protein
MAHVGDQHAAVGRLVAHRLDAFIDYVQDEMSGAIDLKDSSCPENCRMGRGGLKGHSPVVCTFAFPQSGIYLRSDADRALLRFGLVVLR